MNVIRHDHISTYCDVEVVLGALGKKERTLGGPDGLPNLLSSVCAEGDKVKRTCCEDASQTWLPPPEITLHGKSYSTLNKTVAAVATALRAVSLNSSARRDRPQAGGYNS